jgi:hypothetical protein
MSTWFTEPFTLGAPLRTPNASSYDYYDGGQSSQYTALVRTNQYAEVDPTGGIGGGPGLYSTNSGNGIASYSTWALSGTAAARALTPASEAGRVVCDLYLNFIGANYEWVNALLYSCVSMAYDDIGIHLAPAGSNLIAYVVYPKPNGSDFGVSWDQTADYVIGAKGCWRGDGLWHHVRVEVRAGTVTTWTPGSFNNDNDYTGGTLTVSSDGSVRVWIDEVEVVTETGLPIVLNFDGQGADESSPGSWTPDERGVEAYVNRLSLIDLEIRSGCAVMDNVAVGGPEVWVDVPDWHADEYLAAAEYPGGQARCLCQLWTTDAGVMVKARLVSLLADGETVDAVVGTSAEITETVPTNASFAVQLQGTKRHKLQVTSDTPARDLWCAPGAKVTL